MLVVAVTMGVLLALTAGTATHRCGCPALLQPDQPQDLISRMLQKLEESVIENEMLHPSAMLAMNLAGDTSSETHKWLLQQIKEEAVEKAQNMTSGKVALYVLALLSSGQDPRHVDAQGHTVDLVCILQQKTDEEVAKLETDGVPETTLFQVSLDALALCLVQAGGYETASVLLAKKLLSPEDQIFVDTRAIAVQALVCAYGHMDIQDEKDLLRLALSVVTSGFLDEQEERGGLVGNIYSMGLVMQALEAAHKFYYPRRWNCAQAFAVVLRHDYQQPMAIAQVLPALVDKPYLEAGSLAHATSADSIKVHYTITNTLRGQFFNINTTVTVPRGSTLRKVLQAAEEKDPQNFSFETQQMSWGPMVVSIHGLAANAKDRTYWQFLSGADALQEGVGSYQPQNEEHIEAVFSTY